MQKTSIIASASKMGKALARVSTGLLSIGLFVGMVAPLAFGQNNSGLRPRATAPKPVHTEVDAWRRADTIVVKFQEGTHVRERSGRFVALTDPLDASEKTRLGRTGLTVERVIEQLQRVNTLLNDRSDRRWSRYFPRPEADLDKERKAGEQNTGEELADLNLYYAITLDKAVAADTARLIDQLNALDIVEAAAAEPIPFPASECVDIPPVTPDYSPRQGYLNPAPQGVDALFAWTVPGGNGEGIRVIDVEGGWQLTHESIPDAFFQAGMNSTNPTWRQHGTAVLGEMVGCGDGYGVRGIAHGATAGVSSFFGASVPAAINSAAAQLSAGDIILIELQSLGIACNLSCSCGRDFVPMEDTQGVFDAVKAASALDILVVAAAGNGSNNLDCPQHNGKYDREVRDSGAIVVGAGTANGRVPHNYSNYGSRVDVQGWGDAVMSSGYGDIRVNGGDQNQWYTARFGGTSSASPIVVGSVAAVQGVLLAQGLPLLRSAEMIELLRATGTPQAEDARQIGPLPNLREVVAQIIP